MKFPRAPAYWVSPHPTGTVKRLVKPPPFPLQKAVVNGMFKIDCLMVRPGALIMRTPRLDEFKPWFYRVDFEMIFGHQSLGVTSKFPIKFVPDSLLIATGVQECDADWEPSEYAKHTWKKYSGFPWEAPS